MREGMTGYPSIDKPWLKYYSEESINAILPECTIYEYLYNSNKDYQSNTALNYFDNKISFAQVFSNIETAAKAFQNNGVNAGDIVTIASVTTPETIYAFYGLNRIGAVANMVDPRTSAEGIKHYIEEVGSKIVLCIEVALPKIIEAVKGTKVEKIIVVSPADSLKGIKKSLFKLKQKIDKEVPIYTNICISWNSFVKTGNNTELKTVSYEKDKCCVIVHTGGTTGMPKGVMLSNENLNISAYQAIIAGIDMRRDQTWLNIMPPFIAYGIGNGLHLPLIVGMETILIPSFNPEEFDKLLIKYKPNHMVGAPSHYGNLINSRRMDNVDLSYIIAPTVGGDTMDRKLEVDTNSFLEKHNCKDRITKGYGMTEVSAAVSVCTSNECNKLGSVGIPFTHTIISIFDPVTGKELTYNDRGEVCICTPNRMLGYYGNPDATNEIIRIHEDGRKWVHSGDIGYMDEDGNLFIVDRMKRMIIRHDGFKVFPSQIEKVIIKNKFVESCCVVGKSDKTHSQGKLPVAYIVLVDNNADKRTIKEQLRDLCAEELPEYAQPEDFVVIDKMPLTAIGKVDYKVLEQIVIE